MSKVNTICGVDVSYSNGKAVAAAVLWSFSENKSIKFSTCSWIPYFPYISGLLFMREAPIMIEAVNKLIVKPDLILVDGHGIAHPRRAGLAVIVGIILDLPVLGVAKSLLVGEIGNFKYGLAPIILDSDIVGYAVKPPIGKIFYISPGNRIQVQDTMKIIKTIGSNYPVVLKKADSISRDVVNTIGIS